MKLFPAQKSFLGKVVILLSPSVNPNCKRYINTFKVKKNITPKYRLKMN